MSVALERRLESFRVKVQQRVMVADTQIQQLTNYLATLQAECTEVNDKLNRFETQYQLQADFKSGRLKKKKIAEKSSLAQLNAQHQAEIKELQNRLALENTEVQTEFRNNLKAIREKGKKMENDVIKSLDPTIHQLEQALQKEVEREPDSFYNDTLDPSHDEAVMIQEQQILELEKQIEEKSLERQRNLQAAKDKLQECVDSIEAQENDHRALIQKYRDKLAQDEEIYFNQVQSSKQEYKDTIGPLRRELYEKEKQVKQLQKTITKTKDNHESDLRQMKAESDRVMFDFTSINRTARQTRNLISSRTLERTQEIEDQNKILEIRNAIKNAESDLNRQRELNSEMKKQIVRLRFEKRTEMRKRALKI